MLKKITEEDKELWEKAEAAFKLIEQTVELNQIAPSILFSTCQELCAQMCLGSGHTKDQYIDLMQKIVKFQSAKWD